MSNVWKKAFALLLALIMVLMVVACAKDDASGDETTAPATESSEPQTSETTGGETPGGETPGGETPGGETPGGNTPGGNTPTPPVYNDISLVTDGLVQFAIISEAYAYDTICKNLAEALTAKTNANFQVKDAPGAGEHAIYVGRAPKAVMASDLAQLTYSGHLLRKAGSDIHLTGHSAEGIQAAADQLVASITQTGAGDTLSVKISEEVMKVYNPASYPSRNATLLGQDFSKYVVVIPKDYTVYDRFMAERLIKHIGENTGWALEWILDNKRTDKTYQIVIGETNRPYSSTVYQGLATDAYKIQTSGTGIYIAYENYLVSFDAIDQLCALYLTNPTTVDAAKTMNYSAYMVDRNEGTTIRVMSSNVTVVQDAASYERKNNINWEDRMVILTEAYRKYLPDFIGLQEMQKEALFTWDGETYRNVDFYARMQELLGDKYTLLYDETYATIDPILYLSDVWSAGEYHFERFNAMHDITWCVFTNIANPTVQVIIMNVHSAGNVANAQRYNELYKELSETYAGIPIIIMGDMNTRYGEGPFVTTVKDTTLETAGRLTNNTGTHYGSDSLNHAMYKNPIDHIFVPTDQTEVLGYRFVNDRLMNISSGHRPIMADIKLKSGNAGTGTGSN